MPDLDGLNVFQQEAVRHFKGPAMVLAGPGSGKTTVLTKRIQYLIEVYHVPPEEILVITFTRAAALEMKQRFLTLSKKEFPVRFGTFHSVYYHILQNSGFCRDFDLNFPKEEKTDKKYWEEKKTLGFDDIAPACEKLFKEQPKVCAFWQKKYRYLLVDEFQDIAPDQHRTLKLLAEAENNLFLVGDDDQSIYGFRGAGSEIMLSFPKEYPKAKVIHLEYNYRSVPEIIHATGKVISENKNRFPKKQRAADESGKKTRQRETDGKSVVTCRAFSGKREEYEALLQDLKEYKKENTLSHTAVIYRKNRDAQYLIALLRKEGIPYEKKERTKNLYTHFVVEDIFSYLRLSLQRGGRQDFLHIKDRPFRGFGREVCLQNVPDWEKLCSFYRNRPEQYQAAVKWKKDMERLGKMDLFGAVMYIRKGMLYERYLEKEWKGSETERKTAQEILLWLQKEAGEFQSFQEWEDHILYLKEADIREITESHKETDKLQILTMHGAKGLEFERVYLPDINEGVLPHPKAVSPEQIEEERRIFYVGMTRAKKKLALSYCTGTKEAPKKPSRFLAPLLKGL